MPLYNLRHALQTPARGLGIGAKGGAALCVEHIADVDKTQALGHGDVPGHVWPQFAHHTAPRDHHVAIKVLRHFVGINVTMTPFATRGHLTNAY